MSGFFRAKRKDNKAEYILSYDITTFPYHILRKRFVEDYDTAFGAFDIETTTYEDGDKHRGFMYIWQACVGGLCISGRTWEEYQSFMLNLYDALKPTAKKPLVFYCHNLSFEFQFIRKILSPQHGQPRVFAIARRKPLKVFFPVTNIEFRCSYRLTNMSLEKATENEYGNMYIKGVGDLDYRVYRDYTTPLTEMEYGYCMNDVLSLYWMIRHRLKNENDTLASIPLTSTGYVRRECRSACKQDKEYMKIYLKQNLTEDVYTLLKEEGRGGNTAANYRFCGQLIGNADSFDVVSSYPYQLLTKKYPVRRFRKYADTLEEADLNALCQDTPVLFRATFSGLQLKQDAIDAYVPVSKIRGYSRKHDIRVFNGRVLYVKACETTLNDIDWRIIQENYDYDEVIITDVYTSQYALLPLALRKKILYYFQQKCELKRKIEILEEQGRPEDDDDLLNLKYLYAKSKNRLNAIFGMCYTDPVRDEIIYNENDDYTPELWTVEKADVASELERTKKRNNNFLVYAWGSWTTAHARFHLHKLLKLTGEGSVYWDTDSSKAIDVDLALIEAANADIIKECDALGAYAEVDGKRYYCGIYEHETKHGKYQAFKTLGAKKYAYVDHKGVLHCTISGVAKSASEHKPDGARELKTIENLKPGFIFREAGGLTLYYNDEPTQTITVNGHTFLTSANVGTENSTYEIGLTSEYAEGLGINLFKYLKSA